MRKTKQKRNRFETKAKAESAPKIKGSLAATEKEPTIRELAIEATRVFNFGGDKTKYIEFMGQFTKPRQNEIIREMQEVWRLGIEC